VFSFYFYFDMSFILSIRKPSLIVASASLAMYLVDMNFQLAIIYSFPPFWGMVEVGTG